VIRTLGKGAGGKVVLATEKKNWKVRCVVVWSAFVIC